MTGREAPDFLTVEEAAAVMRISRTAAYQQARRYLGTSGREGLPVVRIGRILRVPRYQLERMLGGPINWAAIAPLPTGSLGHAVDSGTRHVGEQTPTVLGAAIMSELRKASDVLQVETMQPDRQLRAETVQVNGNVSGRTDECTPASGSALGTRAGI